MSEWLLCEEKLRVSLSGDHGRSVIVVKNGSVIRFWTETSILEEAAEGNPVQLSAHGGYCRIEVQDDVVMLEYGLDGSGRKICRFPVSKLIEALTAIRTGAMELPGREDILLVEDV